MSPMAVLRNTSSIPTNINMPLTWVAKQVAIHTLYYCQKILITGMFQHLKMILSKRAYINIIIYVHILSPYTVLNSM
jgi:hypothetical protein